MNFPRLKGPRSLLLAPAALVALAAIVPGALAVAPTDLPEPEQGLNLLVVGLDTRKGVTAEEKERFNLGGQACDCTDVMMLVHVSAANDRVDVVSLPRDSLTTLPADHRDRRTGKVHAAHPSKINGAWAEGGSSFAVETVESMTGLPVHRYLEIDFRRFMDTVDRVDGGVSVCTAEPLKDPSTGIDLQPGTKRVAGGEALQYVRSRKADGQMDFGRIQKQQRFVVNTLERLREGILDDPEQLMAFAATLRGTAAAERGISPDELLTLADRLRELPPDRMAFATVPVRGFNPDIAGVGSTLAWDEEGAAEVFGRLREDLPLPAAEEIAPSTIPVGTYRPAEGSSLICP
ncbi:transcriptional regulator [Streptomyces venezuelae]|uniref:LCP family protein n=1 Tax=Streptomyces gardneri TaxID=66892 RepID=UPI0006BCD673|nr:LCP family protein [Streptomyces gardneri]ALO10710.1 transcriptional regulator [Streptomyces venezuelae]QPK47686.1 LCP family protein [Streptomyces gardneri]WRK39132.1 LCP family protein [Streptomyces venezuelae]CUM38808.1 Cell envelope-associated transcriptional attenuator LytR-CpsA-Psr, subfamily A1 (as in PMID19099556) [Streptomyces venezuelae]